MPITISCNRKWLGYFKHKLYIHACTILLYLYNTNYNLIVCVSAGVVFREFVVVTLMDCGLLKSLFLSSTRASSGSWL